MIRLLYLQEAEMILANLSKIASLQKCRGRWGGGEEAHSMAHRIKGKLKTQAQKQEPGSLSAVAEYWEQQLLNDLVCFFFLESFHSSQSPTVGASSGQGILTQSSIKITNHGGEVISQKEVEGC